MRILFVTCWFMITACQPTSTSPAAVAVALKKLWITQGVSAEKNDIICVDTKTRQVASLLLRHNEIPPSSIAGKDRFIVEMFMCEIKSQTSDQTADLIVGLNKAGEIVALQG